MDRLAKFMNDSFTGWRSVNLNDLSKLVVDGDSLCAHLYSQLGLEPGAWLMGGGEYLLFHEKVKEFFAEVMFTGVQLTVVLSGTKDHEQDNTRSRNTQINESMRQAQGRMGWRGRASGDDDPVLPLLLREVLISIIRNLEVQVRVADGSSASEIAAIANHHNCPVLAADSEFFMFELTCGYMPLRNLSTVIASGLLYNVSELQRQFWLKDSKSRLVIPALYGSMHIEGVKTDMSDLESDFKEVSAHESIEEYLTKYKEDKVRENFEAAVVYYCNLPLPSDLDDPLCEKYSGPFSDLPKNILVRLRQGHYQPELLNVHKISTYVLCSVAEDIKRDSTWLAGRSIRQYLYGFMGVPLTTKVSELIRARSSPEIGVSYVSPCNLEPPFNFKEFSEKSKDSMADIVLRILKCNMMSQDDIQKEFNTLDDKWKLPIAATLYWYQTCDDPPAQRHLVKSLLLSFMMCSEQLKTSDVPNLEPVTRETKQDHLTALHVFTQWQCVYHDALSLNYLVGEPFLSTSPAELYSGKVVMYYASFARKNLRFDSVFCNSVERSLFNRFLYLTTGCDDDGRRGKHAKYQPNPKPPATPTAPKLQETNRFTLLSDSDN